ncbi:MAG: cation transporting ATPase C-terminal domain-containing protein [Anaerolineales bacterium]|nr:cation transporting ATPase C-terminal domain-containing protein [Anaerolineales bacterium]
MMAIAFDHISEREVARPQRYDFRSLYIIIITLGLVSTVFDFIYFGLIYRISPEVLQTNWFIASVITELLLLVSIRSMLPVEKAGWPAPLILFLSTGAFLLTLALPIIPWTAAFFEFTRPILTHLRLIVALAVPYLVISELVKRPLAQSLNKE